MVQVGVKGVALRGCANDVGLEIKKQKRSQGLDRLVGEVTISTVVF